MIETFFVGLPQESYQQKPSRKRDREAVRSLQLLQWCSCLICKGNTAKPIFLCERVSGDLAQEIENRLFVNSPLRIRIRRRQGRGTFRRNVVKIRNRSRPPRAPKNACFSIAKTRVLDPDNFPVFFFGQVLLIIDLPCYPNKVKSCFKEDLRMT